MDRRAALAALALLPLSAVVQALNLKPLDDYRRHHLFILASAEDSAAQALAERLAGELVARLPESRAQAVPAPDLSRVTSFLRSRQFDVAVVPRAAPEALAAGLKVLYAAGEHLLVCRDDFLDADAWRIAQVLGVSESIDKTLPYHPGVRAYAAGRPQP